MKKAVSLSRYLAGNVALFLAPLLVGSAFSLIVLNSTLGTSFRDLNRLSTVLISNQLQEFFSHAEQAIHHVENIMEKPDQYLPADWELYLIDAAQEFPFIDRIQIIGSDDRVQALYPFDSDQIGISRAGESLYEAIKKSETLYWSDSYISIIHNQPALTFGIHRGNYTLMMDLNLAWVAALAAQMQTITQLDLQIRIVDRNGIFISHPDPTMVQQRFQQSHFLEIKQHLGNPSPLIVPGKTGKWIVSARFMPDANWYILLLYPQSVFLRSLYQVLAGFLVLVTLVLAGGIIFWRYRFSRIHRAMLAIEGEADQISRGRYQKLRDFGEGFLEFKRIGESLDRMVTGIADREKTLQNRERGFREILDRIELAVVSVDAEGCIQYMNPFFLRLSAYDLNEIRGRPLCELLKLTSNACPFTKIIQNRATLPLERCTFVLKNGQERLIDWSIVQNLDAQGTVAGATGVGHDITDLLDKQREIERSLKEKDILLKEVHHRVKNNLQIISSLLQLQKMASSTDPELKEEELKTLTDAANRVQSIALVHEILYDNDNFGALDFRSYVESLCSYLDLQVGGKPIPIRYGINDLTLDLTSAVPCALIVNEALTNVQKHAFPPGWTGTMEARVEAAQDESGRVRLVIRDNGVGMPHRRSTHTEGEAPGTLDRGDEAERTGVARGDVPEGPEAEGDTLRIAEAGEKDTLTDEGRDHLGLTIMQILVEQLGGRLSLRNHGGTVVTVEFIPKGSKRE